MLLFCLTSVIHPAVPEPDAMDLLLQKVAVGDRAAFAALYQAAKDAVYAFSLSILRDPADAEDVVQDAFVTCWSAAPGYRSQGKPMAWLLTIARNLCLKKLRERRKTADPPDEDWELRLPDERSVSAEDRIVLEQCFRVLNDEERAIVILHAAAGFKHREIAAFLSLPLPTVLSKYARALKKLKAAFEKEEYR